MDSPEPVKIAKPKNNQEEINKGEAQAERELVIDYGLTKEELKIAKKRAKKRALPLGEVEHAMWALKQKPELEISWLKFQRELCDKGHTIESALQITARGITPKTEFRPLHKSEMFMIGKQLDEAIALLQKKLDEKNNQKKES